MHASNHVCRFLSAIGFCLDGDAGTGRRPAIDRYSRRRRWSGDSRHDLVSLRRTAGRDSYRHVHLAGGEGLPARRRPSAADRRLPWTRCRRFSSITTPPRPSPTTASSSQPSITPAIPRQDLSRSDDLSVFVERPTDIKRLIDFMTGASPFAAANRSRQNRLLRLLARWLYRACAARRQSGLGRGGLELLSAKPGAALPTDPRQDIPVAAPHARSADQGRGACRSAGHLLLRGKPGASQGACSTLGVGTGRVWRAAPRCRRPGRKPSGPHEYRVVSNAGHLAFFLCPPALVKARSEVCVDAPGFDRVAFHAQFNADVLAFFQKWLIQPVE